MAGRVFGGGERCSGRVTAWVVADPEAQVASVVHAHGRPDVAPITDARGIGAIHLLDRLGAADDAELASGRRIDAERLAVQRLRYQALCEQAATFVHAW